MAVVQLLVERDNVEAGSKDDFGLTPLRYTAFGGHEVLARLPVECDDIESDSKVDNGRMPLS